MHTINFFCFAIQVIIRGSVTDVKMAVDSVVIQAGEILSVVSFNLKLFIMIRHDRINDGVQPVCNSFIVNTLVVNVYFRIHAFIPMVMNKASKL